ncbi:MAG TPA: sensor histidine kinase [Bryobacteraceae bacterium]|jgi:two-component system LytT family sensor kinase|nr:sensor histidine kinase [Bryobacteraceae bacterium]
MPDLEQVFLISLLIKLGVVASIASILARWSNFKSVLMQDSRTLNQRMTLSLWLSAVFGASVATRLMMKGYYAVDLGLEGSLLAGLVGGYVSGLVSGVLISLPAFFLGGQHLTMPLLAAVGVLGGLLRDLAPDPEEVWHVSPFFDLNIYRFFKESKNHRRAAYHLLLLAAILSAEFLRQILASFKPAELFRLQPEERHPFTFVALYATTLLAVAIPLKIWNTLRTEKKLEEQERLLVEARLAALTSQINPHFLFNTLNSVSSLIRTNPNQARLMVVKLSKVLRRLLRKHENFSALRDELSFIEDYLSIEVARFGDKLRFETEVGDDTLDMLVPSMLLQPLVENSIKHGLSSKVEGGTIRIRTRRNDGRLHILVEDDGVGIPEAKLATLLEHGIGVSNVNERLKVLFGSDYRMWIDSQPGHGTSIQVEMPELQTDLAAAS